MVLKPKPMKRLVALMICAVSLGAAAQLPDYVPTDGLVAWYPFDGNANDFSGYSNHGAINGAQMTEDRFGEANGAFSFSGGTNIQIPHNPQIDFATGDSLTWAIWVLCHPDEQGSVFEKWLNSFVPYPPFHIRVNAVQGGAQVSSLGYCGQNGQSAGVSSVIPWNTWTHVAFTSSASHFSYFIDGQLVTSAEIPQVGCTNDHPLTIGTRAGATHAHYEGKVDDFGIWDRTLSPEEIEALHLLSSPIEGCTDANACNYNEEAQWEDGSCHFNCQFCHIGTVWDESLFKCIVANPADSNFDGCVQLNDLLDLLSAYGNCGAEESPWQCGDPLEYQGYDYETVQIGEQCWFAENLRAENYRNGDEMPSGLSNAGWENLSEGASTLYQNNQANYDSFGLLYNWFAVVDDRGLCPSGWHIPSDGDWIDLEMTLGMSEIEANQTYWRGTDEGTKMKTTYGWAIGSQGMNGTNESGFSALPGGFREADGSYSGIGTPGMWWSSTPSDVFPWYRSLSINWGTVARDKIFDSRSGFSVRCIKDAE